MKSLLLLISFIFLFHFGYSQNDTIIYYKANNKPALGKSDAIRYIKIKEKRNNMYKISTSTKKGDIWMKSKYTISAAIENDSTISLFNQFTNEVNNRIFKPMGKHFYIKEFHENGELKIEGLSKSYICMHWEGQVKEYYPLGNIKSISRYKNNQMQSNKNWLENGEKYIDDIFDSVDVKPEFPGGEKNLLKYIEENIKYPEEAHINSIQGRVFISFVIDTDGKVIGTHVRSQLHPLFGNEGIRVVSEMSNWSVGELDGKPVKVAYTVPINFRLQ